MGALLDAFGEIDKAPDSTPKKGWNPSFIADVQASEGNLQERERDRKKVIEREKDTSKAIPTGDVVQGFKAGAVHDAMDEVGSNVIPIKKTGVRDQNDLIANQEKPKELLPDTPLTEATRETAHTVGSSILHNVTGGLAGLWALAKSGGDVDAAAQAVRDEQDKAYKTKNEGAQKALTVLGSDYNPLNWGAVAGKKAGEIAIEHGGTPAMATALEVAGNAVNPVGLLKGVKALKGAEWFQRPTPAQMGMEAAERAPNASVGAAGAATKGVAETIADPVLKAKVVAAKNPDITAVTRHAEADSLPVPIKLTKGQATGNVADISHEWNNKGKVEAIGKRFQEQGEQLHENIDAIRDNVAPDVYGTDHVQNGRTIIEAYQAHDAALREGISAKYKALEDANGGKFPVDGVAFADAAEKALGKALKTDYVPAPVAKQIERFKNGEPMNFEQFEALRTNLASDIRSSSDGNVRHAASLVLDALESVPLKGDTATLKPLADAARAAAKARFDMLKSDPAYKAVVTGKVSPDDFIQRFVINGKVDNVKTMINNLQPGSVAHQTIAAGVLNHLKSAAGENFNQSSFNKGLKAVSPDGKLLAVVGPEAAKHLDTLGKVANYTGRLPRGSFANTSHTLVGALAEHGKTAAEGVANIKAGGLPVGTWVRGHLEGRALAKHLEIGAGIEK